MKKVSKQKNEPYSFSGICLVCQSKVIFKTEQSWLRDCLKCPVCKSLPRHRAIALAIGEKVGKLNDLIIHESSPSDGGCSRIFMKCKNYIPSQFFYNTKERYKNSVRNENLENLTFESESIDLHVHSDVMEHVSSPFKAIKEMARTLRNGGWAIFSVPVYAQRATYLKNGTIKNLTDEPLEYHGNPIAKNSLVTYHYGQDAHQLFGQWAPSFTVEMRRYFSPFYGVVGEFTDVFVCTKEKKDIKI